MLSGAVSTSSTASPGSHIVTNPILIGIDEIYTAAVVTSPIIVTDPILVVIYKILTAAAPMGTIGIADAIPIAIYETLPSAWMHGKRTGDTNAQHQCNCCCGK